MLSRAGVKGVKQLAKGASCTLFSGRPSADAGPSSKCAAHERYCSHIPSSQGHSPGQPAAHGANRQFPTQRTGVNFLQQGTGDCYELHVRLAALWGMPSELLFERQQAVQALMGPAAGCDTAAHALWLLIRSPDLRHTPEALLRHRVRQLHSLVSHTHIDRAAVLTSIYRHPWILGAMADSTPPAAAAAAAKQRQQQQQHQPAAEQRAAGGSRSSAAFSTSSGEGPVSPATWLQELAAVVLELQQAEHVEHISNGGKGSRGLTVSPGYAAAAVRTYLAAGEAKQWVRTAVSSVTQRFAKATPQPPAAAEAAPSAAAAAAAAPTAATVGWPHPDTDSSSSSPAPSSPAPAPPGSTAGSTSSSDCSAAAALPPTGMAEVMQRLQQQHQQHLLLQQLLASAPHLTALPPELLLARYERLLAVVDGCGDAARQLVMTSPYLLMDYDDSAAGRAEVTALRAAYA